MVYDCMDKDPLVPTSQRLQLEYSTVVQPYGIAKNVLIEFQDSSTLVDFMVVDIDPHQQTSIVLGKPFLKSVRATLNLPPIPKLEEGKMRGDNTRAHEESPSTTKQRTQ
jgi:hypothetical protein